MKGLSTLLEIEAILILLVAVAALATLANKTKVPYPILLVLGGLVLGFVPGLPRIELHPEVVFLLFLPPLLYVSAIFTSWRDFRADLRLISLLAVGLVLMTTCVVVVVGHWAIGLPWAAAFALGAIVSPTDHVSAAAIAQRLGVPRRIVTILEGESLVNDATGIVLFFPDYSRSHRYPKATEQPDTYGFELGLWLIPRSRVSLLGHCSLRACHL
jgi:NhaP-type Na+/H+ or K+/H+ antiporter